MLVNIVANYLQISAAQAQALMELLNLEKRWQEEYDLKGVKHVLATIKTQADFISFIQAVGQTQWFKGHDRSKFSDTVSDQQMNEKYFSLFEGLGLTKQINYDASEAPAFAAILGSSESQVKARLDAFTQDVQNGFAPVENIVFGLGCNRELGVSVIEREQESKDKLKLQNQETTEMNMVSLLTQQTLEQLVDEEKKNKIRYQPINTTSQAKTREDSACVKTADTATSLKQAIEMQFDVASMKKPINIAVYSRQPFVLRQQRDVQQKLGMDVKAVGVGNAFSFSEFCQNPKSIAVCLGEVARLVNVNYTPENLKKLNVELTEAELHEVASLASPSKQLAKPVGDDAQSTRFEAVSSTATVLAKSLVSAISPAADSTSPLIPELAPLAHRPQ